MDENSMLSIFNRENRLLLLVVFCFFVVVVVVVFFSENFKLLFLQLGGGKRWRGFFILPCFVCFVNVSVT